MSSANTPDPKTSLQPPSQTTTTAPPAEAPDQTTAFPSLNPSLFDLLPSLHELLTRLLPPPPPLASQPPSHSNNHATDPSIPSPPSSSPGDQAVLHLPYAYPTHDPLEIQHLATEAAAVRNRISRARGAVRGLPDVGRSVEEQEEEIAWLEGRIGRAVGKREGLRGGARGELGDVKGKGEEDGMEE